MAPAVLTHPEARTKEDTSSMATTESSGSFVTAHPSTLRLSARLQRGIALAEERFDEIERIAPWVWSVPRCSGEGRYVVDLKHATCSCPDHPPAPEKCKHVSAAAYFKAKTACCAGCGRRFRCRDLLPVPEDHLTFYPEDELCKGCAADHGVA